jgi:hypothetical protein
MQEFTDFFISGRNRGQAFLRPDKMSDDDKNMLPLKRISFLGNNE